MILRGATLLTFIVSQTTFAAVEQKGGRSLPLGPFDLTPTLSLSQGYDDNVVFSQSGTGVTSATTFITPAVALRLNERRNTYQLMYSLVSRNFWNFARNNTLNHEFSGLADMDITKRNHLTTNFGYMLGSNPLGTAFTQGDIALRTAEPDTFNQFTIGSNYTYGLPSARGKFELGVSYLSLNYTNNRERTSILDRDDINLQSSISYRIAPKTSAVLEFQNRMTRYADQRRIPFSDGNLVTSIDSDTRRYLIGAKWEASSKLSGEAKIGYQDQEFLDPKVKGFSGLAWLVNLQWAPLRFSAVTLSASREVVPALGFGSAQLTETYGASWMHGWTDRFSSRAGFSIRNIDYLNSVLDTDVLEFAFGLNYRLTNWYTLGLDYSRQDRSSSQQSFAYNKNLIMLSINVNL